MHEKIFGTLIPIPDNSEYDDKDSELWKRRNEKDAVAILQVMYHIAMRTKAKGARIILGIEAMGLEESKTELEDDVISAALNEILAVADASIEAAEKAQNDEKRAKFDAEPHYTRDGKEPNAVLIDTDGDAILIHIEDFSDNEALGAPLDCDRVDIVLNKLPEWSKKTFGFKLAGYVNSNGIPWGLDENEKIQSLSGYDYIAGDCILVMIDEKYNYLPLHPYDAVTVWKYFEG